MMVLANELVGAFLKRLGPFLGNRQAEGEVLIR